MKIIFVVLTLVLVHQSECCMKPCVKILQKICAKQRTSEDRQTFENICVMENYNCENRLRQYEKISDGDCPTASNDNNGPTFVRANAPPAQSSSTAYTVVSGPTSSLGPVKFINQR